MRRRQRRSFHRLWPSRWWLGGMMRPLLSLPPERIQKKVHVVDEEALRARLGREAFGAYEAFVKD